MADTTTALIGALGAAALAFLTYFLTKRKTDAEVAKLNAETDKIRKELEESKAEDYASANANEQIIYDSRRMDPPFDFKGRGNYIYVEHKKTGKEGAGELNFEERILSIKRTNTDGRFSVWLERYSYKGRDNAVLPKNELISGRRKVRVSCEAKVMNGSHALRFIFKDEEADKWVAHEKRQITSDTWTPLNLYFKFPATANVRLRIDDVDVSSAPSSVQMQNIVLAEKVS